MLKGLGNIASLMSQARTMGPKMQEAMEKIKDQQVTGSAGGGMVTVTANGASSVTGDLPIPGDMGDMLKKIMGGEGE